MNDKFNRELYNDFLQLSTQDFNKKYFQTSFYNFRKKFVEDKDRPFTVVPSDTPVLHVKFQDGKIRKFRNINNIKLNLYAIKGLNIGIGYDGLLCASSWLLYTFYDVTLSEPQKRLVARYCIEVIEDSADRSVKDSRKFIVNKSFKWDSSVSEQTKINICRKMYNSEMFKRYYDASRTDLENIEYMKSVGFEISERTFYRIKKDNAPKPSSDEKYRTFSTYYGSKTKEEIMSLMHISQATFYRLKKECEVGMAVLRKSDNTESRDGSFENKKSSRDGSFENDKSVEINTLNSNLSPDDNFSQNCHPDNNNNINNINIIIKSENKKNEKQEIEIEYDKFENESSIEKICQQIISYSKKVEEQKDESFLNISEQDATTCVSGGGICSSIVEDADIIHDTKLTETAIKKESVLPDDYKPILIDIDDSTKKQILLDNEKMKSENKDENLDWFSKDCKRLGL